MEEVEIATSPLKIYIHDICEICAIAGVCSIGLEKCQGRFFCGFWIGPQCWKVEGTPDEVLVEEDGGGPIWASAYPCQDIWPEAGEEFAAPVEIDIAREDTRDLIGLPRVDVESPRVPRLWEPSSISQGEHFRERYVCSPSFGDFFEAELRLPSSRQGPDYLRANLILPLELHTGPISINFGLTYNGYFGFCLVLPCAFLCFCPVAKGRSDSCVYVSAYPLPSMFL